MALINEKNIITGRKSSIGTSAVQLTTNTTICVGVLLKAPTANTASVYVGPSTVTADSADATDGFIIEPGEGVFVTIDNASKLYAISSATGQKLFFAITY